MRGLQFTRPGEGDALRLCCLGAHADDIEIGCGGTVLEWLAGEVPVDVRWAVFSAPGGRAAEARASAQAFLEGARSSDVRIGEFRESYFPAQWSAIKEHCEALRQDFEPDLVLVHRRADRHQDHRVLGELAWNTWRNHLILEYEIPKYEGDLGQVNAFQPIATENVERKLALLHEHFESQRGRSWFDADLFRGLMRLRGMESNSPTRFAEAFEAPKLSLTPCR